MTRKEGIAVEVFSTSRNVCMWVLNASRQDAINCGALLGKHTCTLHHLGITTREQTSKNVEKGGYKKELTIQERKTGTQREGYDKFL